MGSSYIVIKGAREHNLKNIDISIPRDKFVVITGLSGSGKSSLAFDTIYAEGQRRYVESLSAYARQFLEQMDKPDVDSIEGLSPAISIEQKSTSKNPRSTVGTVTEIHDYLRLLFARVGHPHCHRCGRPIVSQTSTQIVDRLLALPEGEKVQILAPLVRGRKGEYRKLLEDMGRQGFVRCRIDGKIYDLASEIELNKNKKHDIEIVIDRLIIKENIRQRLADSVELALKLSEGIVAISRPEEDVILSEKLACITCGISYPEISPRIFSFNSPHGACPTCSGLGYKIKLDPDLIVPDPHKSIASGAIAAWRGVGGGIDALYMQKLKAAAEHYGFDIHTPFCKLDERAKQIVLYGTPEQIKFKFKSKDGSGKWEWVGNYEGVIPNLERRFKETTSQHMRWAIQRFMSDRPCPECRGARLRKESLAIKLDGQSIADVSKLSIRQAEEFFGHLPLTAQEEFIAHQVLKEIRERLGFLVNVGLDYLTLDRSAATLSGGEAERIRLATQIGSSLVGVLYILDEPSIGLHQRDNARLLHTLKRLRDVGNSVLVVEHDAETILAADHVIDLGPAAGIYGGEVVAQGTPEEIAAHPTSLTGQYLSGRKSIPIPKRRRARRNGRLTVAGARENNLKDIRVGFPLGVFTCVTGVSGSGKSTLVVEILHKALSRQLYKSMAKPGEHDRLLGAENIDKVINIDQEPIGRTPRSNPATYTGVFTFIRDLFARVPEARMRGYRLGRFSFNVKGGRCEACQGDGLIKIEMHFLPDVYVRCEVCGGRRYNRETLEIRYKGKNIYEVLEMTFAQALEFYEHIPPLERKIRTVYDVGLDYLHLGQSATTLSGGEAQRIKLSRELSKVSTGRTLYILDEPTTGLHFDDIRKLLDVLDRLVQSGNTVVVIEHNLDVIKTADYLIDLGPEGGDEGGMVVASGTPEQVAQNPNSYTGQHLRKALNPMGSPAKAVNMDDVI